MVKGNQALVATDKCLTGTPDVSVNILECMYGVICESRDRCMEWKCGG
jgi:hypothetical protein